MEPWQRVWRDGFAKVLSTAALVALRDGLRADDPNLIQGNTTVPPPLLCVKGWMCMGACAIGYGAWQGDGFRTVGEVEEHFAKTCGDVDQLLGDIMAARCVLSWWDDTPREIARVQLLCEVEATLAGREVTA